MTEIPTASWDEFLLDKGDFQHLHEQLNHQ